MKEYRLTTHLITADKNWFRITFIRPDLEKESYEQRMGAQKQEVERVTEKVTVIISNILKFYRIRTEFQIIVRLSLN